ncbi:YibE/F family protein [Finegoldia magna]|uniref:YibE/F family protein n=1 Tax=Finegoldia magna TaxID=1260 RepID=UPI002803F27E|nr:YibE/F family protein [Finegoldia magna]MDU5070066.1 YibE/F family protein [Finegoldia magna]
MKKIVNVILILLLIGIFFLNRKLDVNESLISYKGVEYLRAKVVEVVDESLDYPDNSKPVGVQEIKAKILKTGKVVELDNELVNTHSIKVHKGSNVILIQNQNSGSTDDYYYSVYNYDRSIRIFVIIALFVIFLAVIAGVKGLKSAIALFISIYIILFFDVALLMNGYNNILVTIITVILCAVYSLVVLYGYSKMTLVNMISIGTSFLIAAIMVKIIGKVLYVSGHNMENVETLILVGKTWGLRIENLLFSAVSIASLGASMDVSVSISSSLKEIKSLNTDLDSRKLFQSGMNIGKDIIGTMVNTLVFAFIGSSLVTIMVLISHGVSFNQLVNSDFFSVEITKGLIGTVVVIIMVPVTSLFSSIIYNHKGEN